MIGRLDLGLFRHRRVRLIRQTELGECGIAAIAMIGNYHGLKVDAGSLRRRFQPSMRGASLHSLIDVADQLGLRSRAVKLRLDQLHSLALPAVLHWNMNHYVVLEEIRRNSALIHNPEGSSRWIRLSEVSNHFTGVALEVQPAEDFEVIESRQQLRLSQLWNHITGLKRALAQTLVLSLVLQAFVLASPYYMQIALDSALPALDNDLLAVLAIGFGIFTLFNAIAALLRSFVLLATGTNLGYGIATNVARRLLRLPISWFEKRHIGDIISRFQSVSPIQQFLVEGAIGAALDGSLTIFTLVVMAFYSPLLASIAVTAFVLNCLVRAVSYWAQRDAQEDAIVMSSQEQSTLIESLRGISTIRLLNRETHRLAFWQTRLSDAMNAGASMARIGAWQQMAYSLIFGLETIVATWLAVRMVIAGGFTVGMVFAYTAYKLQFMQKATSLLDQIVSFKMLGLHLDRLSDIALSKQDSSFDRHRITGKGMNGGLELRNVGFRYSSTDPWVLKNVNLCVSPGSHIAITGPSGSGKSTLVKVVLGLLEPEEGEILVDGTSLTAFGLASFRESVSAVLQDDHLFAGNLADNIALFDDKPNMELVVLSARAAAIDSDIALMPMGYETLVGDMGSALSGGQKQRLLLARALYRQPKILVVDEGTSHLDFAREQEVNTAISELGITRIIVAHRLETIMGADTIYSASPEGLIDVTESFSSIRMQLPRLRDAVGKVGSTSEFN